MDASAGRNTRTSLRASHSFIAVAALLISGIAQANTNLLNNGSFEAPSVPSGKFTEFTSGSSAIGSWIVVGSETSVVNSSFTSFLLHFPASEGSQWLDLTGYPTNNSGGVEQTARTVPGTAYLLTFAVGNVFDPRGLYGTTSSVAVTVNGLALGTFTNSCRTCTKIQSWQTFNISFVASGPTAIIRFMNADPSTDNSNGLDDVVLTEHVDDSARERQQR